MMGGTQEIDAVNGEMMTWCDAWKVISWRVRLN